ncbi:MAG: hypothetical protein M3Q15_04535 [Pseudomonadota bacterium]|nr:hypothetical protein [Pseudomonadota bacterium]
MAIQCFLYDADGQDREIKLADINMAKLDKRTLLWVDSDGEDDKEMEALAAALEIDREVLRPSERKHAPTLDNYGTYFRFNADTAPGHSKEGEEDEPVSPGEQEDSHKGGVAGSVRLDFLVGEKWLLTFHRAPIPFLQHFRAQDKAETHIGELSPQKLAASLLDWHLGEYFHEVSLIEASTDKLEERILREEANDRVLSRIVAVRRRIARLRAILVAQRDIFYGLSRPDFALVADAGALPFYEALAGRFDRAVDEVERSRDVVVGSFDIYTARASQQTNDLVKALTFITAIIGVCAAVAGLFGMNFEASVFKAGDTGFYAATFGLAGFSLAAVALAKLRAWL